MTTAAANVARLYEAFGGHPRPKNPWICEQCAPDLTAAELARTPLRSMTFTHLAAVHVMSLDDDALRHYFPRLMDLLLRTPAPVLDFRVSELAGRLSGWSVTERAVAAEFADAVWNELVGSYPALLGYFSDCPSALELLDWCGLSREPRLDALLSAGEPAACHLADLVVAVVTGSTESCSSATLVEWVGGPAVGERLEEAFLVAGSEAVADQLASAHELWTVCAR